MSTGQDKIIKFLEEKLRNRIEELIQLRQENEELKKVLEAESEQCLVQHHGILRRTKEIDKLTSQLKTVVEALELYADRENWLPRIDTGDKRPITIGEDHGKTARKALKELEG